MTVVNSKDRSASMTNPPNPQSSIPASAPPENVDREWTAPSVVVVSFQRGTQGNLAGAPVDYGYAEYHAN